jgi:hypothetical protein
MGVLMGDCIWQGDLRPAPYHVPVSAHYSMQNHVVNPEQMNRQFNYPISSPHNPHAARTSPVSPGSMYMHSPASQHSSQSLPNSSPRSIHSPPGGYGNFACCNERRQAHGMVPIGVLTKAPEQFDLVDTMLPFGGYY